MKLIFTRIPKGHQKFKFALISSIIKREFEYFQTMLFWTKVIRAKFEKSIFMDVFNMNEYFFNMNVFKFMNVFNT